MTAILKSILLENKVIKIIAFITGYTLWSFLGHTYKISKWVEVPICFYNIPENTAIVTTPEKIYVHLYAKRNDILNCTDTALHIDVNSFGAGEHIIIPKLDYLFLPAHINVIGYNPTKIRINMTKK